ncbi:MAG: hypothetical protein ACTSUE_07540 [Promethearchaeota archaeon]
MLNILSSNFDEGDHPVRQIDYGTYTPQVKKTPVIVLNIQSEWLNGVSECFLNFNESPESQEILKLLALLFYIVSHPWLADPEYQLTDKPTPENMDLRYFEPEAPENGYQWKSQQFIEVLRTPKLDPHTHEPMLDEEGEEVPGQTVGYRVWFCPVILGSFDFNVGIENVIALNKIERERVERQKERSNQNPNRPQPTLPYMQPNHPDCWKTIINQEAYNLTLSTYHGDDLFSLDPLCTSLPLKHKDNPAGHKTSLNRLLAVEDSADETFIRSLMKRQRTYNDYFTSGTIQFVFPLPDQVYRYTSNQCYPRFILLSRLPDLDEPVVLGTTEATDAQKRLRKRIQQCNIVNMPTFMNPAETINSQFGKFDDVQKLAKLNQLNMDEEWKLASTEQEARENIYAMRRDALFCSRFSRVWKPYAHIADCLKAFVTWGEQEQKRVREIDPDMPWCMNMPGRTIMDPTLGCFGNMVARSMYSWERVWGFVSNHEEMEIINTMKYTALHHKLELKNNCLFPGIAQAGKSYCLNLLTELNVPGTFMEIARETKQAFSTGRNFNYYIMVYDDMQSDLLVAGESGVGETGDTGFKTRLTKCIINTLTNEGKADGIGRETMYYTTEMITATFGATNERKSAIHGSIASRFYIRDFMSIDRKGYNVMDQSTARRIAREQTGKVIYEQRVREHRKTHYLYMMIETMIRTGDMEGPDLSIASIYFTKMVEYLQGRGYANGIITRDMERLINQAYVYTIKLAIYLVFFTDIIWKEPVPFELWHVKLCQNFMFSSEAIAYFVWTQLGDQFVNTLESFALGALLKDGCGFRGNEYVKDSPKAIKWKRIIGTDKKADMDVEEYDFNYIEIDTKNIGSGSIMEAMCIKISNVLQYGSKVMSMESIKDVLLGLGGRRMRVKEYVDVDERGTKDVWRDLIVYEKWCHRVLILRDFAETLVQESASEILIDAIKSTFHKKTRERRIVLALSYRSGDEPGNINNVVAPEVLRCMMTERDPSNELIVSVPNRKTKQDIEMFSDPVFKPKHKKKLPRSDSMDSFPQSDEDDYDYLLKELEKDEQEEEEEEEEGEEGESDDDVMEEEVVGDCMIVDDDLEQIFFEKMLNRLGVPDDDTHAWLGLPEYQDARLYNTYGNINRLNYPSGYLAKSAINRQTRVALSLGEYNSPNRSALHISKLCERKNGSRRQAYVPETANTNAFNQFNDKHSLGLAHDDFRPTKHDYEMLDHYAAKTASVASSTHNHKGGDSTFSDAGDSYTSELTLPQPKRKKIF